jgi:hypothetical protein
MPNISQLDSNKVSGLSTEVQKKIVGALISPEQRMVSLSPNHYATVQFLRDRTASVREEATSTSVTKVRTVGAWTIASRTQYKSRSQFTLPLIISGS